MNGGIPLYGENPSELPVVCWPVHWVLCCDHGFAAAGTENLTELVSTGDRPTQYSGGLLPKSNIPIIHNRRQNRQSLRLLIYTGSDLTASTLLEDLQSETLPSRLHPIRLIRFGPERRSTSVTLADGNPNPQHERTKNYNIAFSPVVTGCGCGTGLIPQTG